MRSKYRFFIIYTCINYSRSKNHDDGVSILIKKRNYLLEYLPQACYKYIIMFICYESNKVLYNFLINTYNNKFDFVISMSR